MRMSEFTREMAHTAMRVRGRGHRARCRRLGEPSLNLRRRPAAIGLRATYGLLSRTGIVPNALSLDTAGPMARSVYEFAVVLGVTAGIDLADAATMKSAGKVETDYTKFLKVGSLKGARIGVLRDHMGQNAETDRIVEESVVTLQKLGAVIVDSVSLPTNPILKPQAAEVVKKHGEISLAGVGYPTPNNQCWPEPVPYIFWTEQSLEQVALVEDQMAVRIFKLIKRKDDANADSALT
jgi:hypothetical protein